jgi:hypothetical protein
MEIAQVVNILQTVPAKNLKLIQLVNELVGPDGDIDAKQVDKRDDEIALAKLEAEAYARATEQAIETLMRIRPVTGGNS